MGRLLRRRRGERGATAVEYGLLVAGVVLAMVLAVEGFKTAAGLMFHQHCLQMASHPSQCD